MKIAFIGSREASIDYARALGAEVVAGVHMLVPNFDISLTESAFFRASRGAYDKIEGENWQDRIYYAIDRADLVIVLPAAVNIGATLTIKYALEKGVPTFINPKIEHFRAVMVAFGSGL